MQNDGAAGGVCGRLLMAYIAMEVKGLKAVIGQTHRHRGNCIHSNFPQMIGFFYLWSMAYSSALDKCTGLMYNWSLSLSSLFINIAVFSFVSYNLKKERNLKKLVKS